MFEIKLLVPIKRIDQYIEKLQLNDIYNAYYEAPFQVTTEHYGYGYIEDEAGEVYLKVIEESDDENKCIELLNQIKSILDIDTTIEYSRVLNTDWQEPFENIDLGNGWIIASPEDNISDKNKINFESLGAFGTGIHETTQDCLRIILKQDFSNKSVLDLGTGSGLLSIAAATKNAKEVLAVDIRDVKEEVHYNAALNNITNIEVAVGNILEDLHINRKFDYIFINIGGEEILLMFSHIDSMLKSNGKLLISGLVTWSYNDVVSRLKDQGYIVEETLTTNEWVTIVSSKIV